MGDKTGIEWTDATWNPWRGCSRVSPGCAHCYMFTEQDRYGLDPYTVVRTSDATFYAPLRKREWREIAPGSLVFTCSWSDFFHEAADAHRLDAWEVIRARPDLNWQILTKRPENIAARLPADWGEGWPNVWLGVSVENRRYVGRADVLREIPAAVRFISAEPLLGPLVPDHEFVVSHPFGYYKAGQECWADRFPGPGLDLTGIDWLIVGGESGEGFRRMSLDWVRDLHNAALSAGTAIFVKQDAARRPGQQGQIPDELWIKEWPHGRQLETGVA